MTPLDWELRLHNSVSEAAKQAGMDVKSFAATVSDAEGKLWKLTAAQQAETVATSHAKKEHEGLFGEFLKAELWNDAIKESVRTISDLGEAFIESAMEATDFDYKATVALTHLTGSAAEAEDIIQHARAFASGVGEDLDKVTTTFQRLAATGLRGNNLTAAADAANDLAKVTGRSFDQTSALFEMIGSDKGLGGKAVRQLAAFPGLLNQLEKHFGFVPGTAHSFELLSKHLTEAPIKGAAGLNLLEGMILKVAHEKSLGDVGVEMGNSFEGAFTKIRNDWKMALGDMSKDPAFIEMRGSLNQLSEYFQPANEGGKMLKETIHALVVPAQELFSMLNANPDILKGVFDSAVVAAQTFGKILEGIVVAMHGVQEGAKYLGAFFATGSFAEAKKVVEEGNYEDRAAKARAVAGPEVSLPPEANHEALRGIPHAADGGDVEESGLAVIHKGERIVPDGANGAAGGGSLAGATFHFHVSVDGGGHGMDEQLLVARLEEKLPGAMMNAFEQLAQMKGGR